MRSFVAAAALSLCCAATPSVSAEPAGQTDRGGVVAFSLPAPIAAVNHPSIKQHGAAWFASEWRAYRARFLLPDGRIIDNANGGVSHSEGQGYGLLLAETAGDPESFATIWSWTRQHLYVRPDGLASWKWDPTRNAVADPNNATDGDILVAWALDRAARRFDRQDYRDAARSIAEAIGRAAVVQGPSGSLLLPGVVGFTAAAQADGPVLNLSYYVFPAFDTMKALAPAFDWDGVARSGLALLKASSFGPLRLPTDWIALGTGAPQPAAMFPKTFGYDAIRIPLYLAWAGRIEDERAHRFSGLWNEREDLGPYVTDVATGSVLKPFGGVGYKLVAALATCAVKNIVVPREIVMGRDDLYYPATLRLLSLAALQERFPQCL